MYGRQYGGQELTFEPSGGLMHAALVMRDKETGSYWPIMTGAAAAGALKGTRLDELPVGVKATWEEWRHAHPDTTVLSVGGAEHVENDPYDQYFASDAGFRDAAAADRRLPTKEPIWAFELGGRRYAVPFRVFEGGGALKVAGQWIFLHRQKGASVYASTSAWAASNGPFDEVEGAWVHQPSGRRFEPARGAFEGKGDGPRPLPGFDTFWYVWSLTHPDTEVLTSAGP